MVYIVIMEIIEKWLFSKMFLAFLDVRNMTDLDPYLLFALIANSIECVALVTAIIVLVRHDRAQQRQLEALQILITRGIEPEQLVKLASTPDRLSESDVEDLLASRGRPPKTESSIDRR
jgi:hypothetical protein